MSSEADEVFERAAELFGLLSAPMRLRILSELCTSERNVSQLLDRLGVHPTQSFAASRADVSNGCLEPAARRSPDVLPPRQSIAGGYLPYGLHGYRN